MDRRFLTVLGVSLLFALVISSVFYQMSARSSSSPARPEAVEMKDLVVAAKPLNVGTTIKPGDVTISKVPVAAFPKGGFMKVEEVLDRPVVSNILAEESVIEGRLAPRGSGAGLAPIIPVGMRAVTVRVNDVVGVAGFVLPGMRVDITVTGRPPSGIETITTTVLQNITVLSAGQTMAPDARGQAINAPTVTLLVTPEQAEVIILAGSEGRIQLVLRNGSDNDVQKTSGVNVDSLYGNRKSSGRRGAVMNDPNNPGDPELDAMKRRQRRSSVAVTPVNVAAPAAPALPPVPEQIVVIRGNNRSVETVGMKPGTPGAPPPVAIP
ncbi:Flp pilus assembly protein CpaB [Bryobacter aggregatus]|uniref:Flp pilus assembly protein CpaB n=1 Tax=Bryobacter aggregatus TaxID=360054 RepID=UPI00068D83AF|nr:Flp pilus assembly protein CpaB [Bryobacter aggregatus]